jgi:hypothetical protein
MRFGFCLAFLFFVLPGCGYHFPQKGNFARYHCLSIPFIEGDEKGQLTSSLIREISARIPVKYTHCGGDLELKVILLDKESDYIGYRLAPRKETDNVKVVVPEEGRLMYDVSIALVEVRTGEVLMGPLIIYKTLDFDFEPDFSNVGFHHFSLGQLDMHPQAQEGASSALNQLIAQKIVDILIYCWQ